MLVNTIAFYPRPVRMLVPSWLENEVSFGAPLVDFTSRKLRPTILTNDTVFGNSAVSFALKEIAPSTVQNTSQFGSPVVENLVPGLQTLHPTVVANGNQFGLPAVSFATKVIQPTRVANTSQFGSQTIANVFVLRTSYSNSGGTGNRTSSITVTTTATLGSGSISNLVDGDATANGTHACWFSNGQGGREVKFDFGAGRIIRQARWKQDSTATHGSWKWQGSNDDASYTDIGGSFTLGGVNGAQIHTELITNTTAYRYYKLLQVSGTTSGGPWLEEIEFFIDGATDDLGDTSYRYPMGGGADAGGATSGSGGNGVDRSGGSSHITVTGTYTVASAGSTPSNLIDGAAGNSTTDSIDFQSNQTAISIKFDFGAGNEQRIDAFTWEQSNSTGQGNYDFAGSNDDAGYTTLASNFSLVNGASLRELTFTNPDSYRYYRLTQVGGNTASSPWIHEIYFKCCPDTRGS